MHGQSSKVLLPNIRSPAEVNSNHGRVVEVVSPTRSVSSEGQRRIPSPRGEENGQRWSGNALVDAASVPVVYPPIELGRRGTPYELGGPGMIPGGMPSGVPASVYRTPIDALNHQQANRDIMSSVYENAIQCSPELFTPAESAYYTAPNTCL